MSAADALKSTTELSFVDDSVLVKLLPNIFRTPLDLILEDDCVHMHILSDINCHPLRLFDFLGGTQMVKESRWGVNQMNILDNTLLSLTFFSKGIM